MLYKSDVMTTTSVTASRSVAPPAEQTVERSSTTLPDTGGSPVGEADGGVVTVCEAEGELDGEASNEGV